MITMIELKGCPYCAKAHQAIEELKGAHTGTEILFVDESNELEKLKDFHGKYYYVPSLFVNGEKIFEASPEDDYEKIRAGVEKAFEASEKADV